MKPGAVLETVLYATDLDAAEHFYSQVLGLPVVSKEAGGHVFFPCGAGMLLVFNPAASVVQNREFNGSKIPRHGTTGPGHMAFAATEDEIEAWRQRLMAAGVTIESDVRWPNGARSIYFRDPAGNCLEFAMPRLWGL